MKDISFIFPMTNVTILGVFRTHAHNSGVTIKAKSRWGGNKSITKVVIYQNVGLGLKFTRQPA